MQQQQQQGSRLIWYVRIMLQLEKRPLTATADGCSSFYFSLFFIPEAMYNDACRALTCTIPGG
jgi:hypothetical protein